MKVVGLFLLTLWLLVTGASVNVDKPSGDQCSDDQLCVVLDDGSPF